MPEPPVPRRSVMETLKYAFVLAVLAAVPCAAVRGEEGSAEALFREGKFAEALEAFSAEAAKSETAWRARLGVADCLAALGRAEEADSKYFDLMMAAPRDELALGGALSMLYPRWWAEVLKYKRLPDAERKLMLVLERNKDDLLTVQYLAVALHMQSKLAEALKAYERALALQGENEWARSNMALLLDRIGRHAEAAESYLRAVALNPAPGAGSPGGPDAFGRVNSICYRWSAQRNFPDAKRTWEALSAVAGLPPDRKALTHLNLGILFMNHGLPEAAGEQLRAALESNPGMLDAHNNIGLVMWSQGNREGAKKEFSALVGSGDPGYTNGHENIGNLELESGNPGRALKYFEGGLERARTRLGAAKEALKRGTEALATELELFALRNELEAAEYAVFRLKRGIRESRAALVSKRSHGGGGK